MCVSESEPTTRTTVTSDRICGTSYEMSWPADRRPPMSEYLLIDAQPAMTVPTHDNNLAATGDDYATTTISFFTPAGPGQHTVQLLFGGHLAAGLTVANNGSPRGWGSGLGAGSVAGGPYHIKWTGVDGASPIWHDGMLLAEQDMPIRDFTNPGGLVMKTVSYPEGITTTDWYIQH